MENVNSNAHAAQSNSTSTGYINLITEGIGFAGRCRIVRPKGKSPSFLAMSISAMYGQTGVENGISYTQYDVKVVTDQAIELVREFMEVINDPKKLVRVRFQIGDTYCDSFTYTQGPKAGQMAIINKGRLLKITHLWVKERGVEDADYVLAYKLDSDATQGASEEEQKVVNG